MKKSIFLFFAAILCAIGMNAATVTSDGTARLYFNMKAVSWWNAGTNGNGNFAYFFNNSTGKYAWSAHAVKHSGDTYYVVIPNGTWAGVILTRNNTSTAPSWNNKWNQTGDITLSNTSNYISKFSEGSATVTWGTAVKPASNAAVSAVASTIFVGASTILTPSLTSNADINDIKSTTYTISPNTGASVSGNTFTATAEGTYTITATVTYHPDGYSDTKLQSTATATTTITVEELPTYTVTVNAGEGGTVTEGGIVTEGSSINITATPAENYEFNGWTITTGEGTFDNENAVSTTFSPTSDATIQANFRSTATYALKVIAGANIASAEGNVDPVTLGESYDITATPVVGYTFAGWTAEPTENATFATQESTTQVTVLNGSVNVTATATETMSALTTANSFDQDTPPAEVPTATATEIGIVTTAEVTATDVTGYTFVGWELTNCVSDDELTAKTIAVKSNGDGAAATATAKYEIIKLTYTVIVPEGTEKCYIAGDMNTWTFTEMENQGNNVFTLTIIGATKEHGYKYACGNEWKYVEKTADGNEVSNRSYTANDKVLAWNDPLATNLYLRGTMNGWGTTDRFKKETEEATTAIVIVKLDANTTFDFKVANADWSEGYSSTEQFTATATQTLKTSVSSNAQLKTSIEGNYTFTWNVKTKELTITYPELPKYQVTATINPAETGTVTGIDEYEQGSTATLIATPADGYKFVNWTENEVEVSTAAEYTFEVLADHNLVANFKKKTYTVTATAVNGTITGLVEGGIYEHGATATLTATANDHYVFVNWTAGEEVVAETAEYTFTVEEDVELTANFARDTHTVNATAENGTVTGSGEYTHGEEVTLTATPAFDYQFVNWTAGEEVVSTENPLTITVAEDVTLEANFAEVAATEKKESGVFSISAHKTATFATGNLQHNVGTGEWRFAKQQYQVVGEQNINLGDPAFTGWIDMLGWSNGEENKYGVNPSNVNELYDGEFVDWGTKMGEGWSTLSADEWKYLLNTRENAASLKQIAKVGDILGLLLFPDGWVMPEGVVVEAEKDEYFEVDIYNYTLEQWTKLEQVGALFLPAAGRRTGGYGNMINYDQVEETNPENLNGEFYRWQDNTNIYCYYWTSTINEDKNVSYLHNVLALGKDEYTIGNAAIWSEKGRYGQSVRLAKVVYDKHEVTVTANATNGTVTGAGTYNHGEEVTLTATANDHYVFVNWTKGEEVVSTENPYTFNVTADVALVANFALDSHTVTANATNGTVTGAGTYNHGEEVTLTATANDHYVFVNWTKGEEVVSTENPYTFNVTDDVDLVANFKLDSHTVAATAENGTVEGAGTYEHGTEVTLTATAAEGYEFVKWSNESTENPLTITVTEDVTISAIFQEVVPVITHTVTWYTAVGDTTVVILEKGDAITKPATDPEMEGYVFMGWTNECFVAEDGSDFTAIEDFGTADADKEYYAVFAVETTTGGGGDEIVTDLLNRATTGATNQNYVAWSGKTATSSAVYAGQSAGSNESIQLRSKNSNSGIVTTTSGGKAKKVTIDWNTNTSKGRTVIIYGKNSAYTQATDLYDTNNQGTELGTIVCGTSTELTISGEYAYIGICSKDGAMYLNSVSIDWETKTSGEPTTTYSNYMTTCTPEEYTIVWSVNGVTKTTTVVEGDALVLPEAPAAPDACSDKVFMGWATTATVHADGSAINWVNETIIPESDNTYYAVFATEIIDAENSEIESVTLAYAGGTTANMTVDSNNAAIVGLNAEEWSVTAAKGGSNNAPGLNKDNDIRLYYSADGSNTITVSSLVENVTISNITITYTGDNYSNSKVLVNDAVVTGTDGTYTINANSFVITNGNTSNAQVRIKSIVINYTKPSTTYADYSTICVIPEYTVTFDYSVDAGYIIVNDKRISEKKVKYAEGTVLTVKALTFNNYRFDAWADEEGADIVTTPEYTFTVTGDVVLQAIFTSEQGAVGTGVENNNVVTSETMKVIQNGRLFIIREGKIYNAQGQVVK